MVEPTLTIMKMRVLPQASPGGRYLSRVIPADLRDAANVAGAILAVLAVLGGVIGIVSATPTGEQLSSAAGIVHRTEQSAVDVVERTDIQNEKEIPWAAYQRVDDNRIRVFFPAGNENCYGYRAEVKESPLSVDIKVYGGTLPQAPEFCSLEATTSSIVVTLAKPLGARLLRN